MTQFQHRFIQSLLIHVVMGLTMLSISLTSSCSEDADQFLPLDQRESPNLGSDALQGEHPSHKNPSQQDPAGAGQSKGYGNVCGACFSVLAGLYTIKNKDSILFSKLDEHIEKKIGAGALFVGAILSFFCRGLFQSGQTGSSDASKKIKSKRLKSKKDAARELMVRRDPLPSLQATYYRSLPENIKQSFKGLSNEGNYCYMNSSLQMLWSMPEIMDCCRRLKEGTIGHYLYQLHENILGIEDARNTAEERSQRPVPKRPAPTNIGWFGALVGFLVDFFYGEEDPPPSEQELQNAKEAWKEALIQASSDYRAFHEVLFYALYAKDSACAWYFREEWVQPGHAANNAYRKGDQEDAAECFRMMLDKIRDEIKENNKDIREGDESYITDPFSTHVRGIEYWKEVDIQAKDAQGNLCLKREEQYAFEGYGDEKTPSDQEPMHVLSVGDRQPFNEAFEQWKNKNALQAFQEDSDCFKPEFVKAWNDEQAERHQGRTFYEELTAEDSSIAGKKFSSSFFEGVPPQSLLFSKSLKGHQKGDNNSYQSFASRISVPYKDSQTQQMLEKSYSLKGMICRHAWSNQFGHYVAYIRQDDNRWLNLNDASLTLLEVTGVFDRSNWIDGGGAPYVAYYERDD